jgi:hypothetical protein
VTRKGRTFVTKTPFDLTPMRRDRTIHYFQIPHKYGIYSESLEKPYDADLILLEIAPLTSLDSKGVYLFPETNIDVPGTRCRVYQLMSLNNYLG